ncbi:MAG: site-specific integrase [Candidatus Bathyarchaeota archaeon]|nr:site-specific integrase [Candidatus Bathyarchaeota archaeon]
MDSKLVKQLLEQLKEDEQTQSVEKMNITNVMLWMQRKGYKDSTIKKAAKLLRHLERHCNTQIIKEVETYISQKPREQNGYKQSLVESYDYFLRSLELKWKDKPFYERDSKKHRAPKEAFLDFMISHFRLELALKLSMSKDLGTRPQELVWLKVKDIDLTNGATQITGAKNTKGREGKLRKKSLELLKIYIQKRNLTLTDKLFNISSNNFANDYRHSRNRLAEDYNMPKLKQICLYDFRRFKGTREYHLTRDVLHVKEVLGHKDNSLRSTLLYITMESNITWIPKLCTTKEEIAEAISNDWRREAVMPDGTIWYKYPA